MSLDPTREALHRVAREMGVSVSDDPLNIAVHTIREIKSLRAHIRDLEQGIERFHHRLHILEGSTP